MTAFDALREHERAALAVVYGLMGLPTWREDLEDEMERRRDAQRDREWEEKGT